MSFTPSSNNIDYRNIVETAIRQFIPWLAVVLLVAYVANQPGVVCVTPMAWLIALRVGLAVVTHSRSESSSQRKIEALAAGSILGLLQGLLFAFIIAQVKPISADDVTRSITLTIIMIVVGIIVSAALAFITAYLSEQRRERRANQSDA